MPSPVKLAILEKLTEMLASMSIADGYSRDYAGLVFRGRQLFGQESGGTAISIVEYPRPDEALELAGSGNAQSEEWRVLVQGWTNEGSREHPTDALYYMLDDVESMLYRTVVINEMGDGKFPEYRFYRMAADVRIGPGVVKAPDNTSAKAFFYLPVRIQLARTARVANP